jgi:molybdenum cofactor cytidylyltransferase
MIPVIILAAGASTRMGTPKALLADASGRPFIVRLIETMRSAGAEEVVVVVGFHRAAVREAIDSHGLAPRVVENPTPEAGQLSSLQVGLAAIDRPGVRGALVTLVDVPLVLPDTVRAVLEAYDRSGALIVRPVSGPRHGHPVLFDRALFSELRRADPRLGAKPVVHAHAAQILDVPVTDAGAFEDIDTPEDYDRVVKG